MSSATSTLCRLPSDLESVGSYSVTPDVANNDPLDLRTKVVPDEQLVTLRSTGRVGRRLAAFYRAQNKVSMVELAAPPSRLKNGL